MTVPPATFHSPAGPASLTLDQALQAVKDLRPQIMAEAAETEQRTFHSQELHEEFSRHGLYDMLRPKTYGGYEFTLSDYMKVAREVARADMSTAWSYAFASGHVLWLASWWPEKAQKEIFSAGHVGASGTSGPGGKLEKADGGWILNGTYPYASGGAYSSHFIGHANAGTLEDGSPGPSSVFAVPRKDWKLRDDWGKLLGLRGSSSHTVDLVNVFLPEHLVLEGQTLMDMNVAQGTPGYELHDNPLYAGRGVAFFSIELANLAVGGALAALDEYEQLLQSKRTAFPPITLRSETPTYLHWYADAVTRLDSAQAQVDRASELFATYCEEGVSGVSEYTAVKDLRANRLASNALNDAWKVVESIIIRTAGSSVMAPGTRLERIWRDLTMVHGHQNSAATDLLAPLFAAGQLPAGPAN